MGTGTATRASDRILTDDDVALAEKAGRKLEAFVDGPQPVSARFGAETVDIPTSLRRPYRCYGIY